ncbi:nucleotidyltransferase domain-containing protein [Lederbergia lenta]|uniref:Nucleotidyltransferase n=1 Tax=Lederbergia lenta TaxID=1467 RepID=A0A2X4W2V0_LEDLE|nr:nucleotidyltransferase domain-containing protein [Lederbergia lenta]MCM3109616.1 nucleotidyltransferase domain-containing protein [Lederbergia lenta]MEC2324632.1 nucleotidyltransferase domain-containing protein [Lederbergia lenta]SQI58927.1 nucleotidyltransferase [Lederbergia lenta]
MGKTNRLKPIEAAKSFILYNYPNCQGALLAGSVVRGEATETSDLDIVIFDQSLDSSYRESFIEFGWPIEIFVHNLTSYKHFFEMDCKVAKPSMPRMVSEGIVLIDDGIIDSIREEANDILMKGPEKWSQETIKTKQYFISDALDDFLGSNNRAEDICIASTLAELVHEFVLRTNGQWIGASKWIIRALKQFDENFTEAFVEAFEDFYRTGNKNKIVKLIDEVLDPYGGRLFAGFSLGKN